MEPLKTPAFPGRTIDTGEKTWLYFGGTAYLGLQADEAFQEILIANIRRFGTSYGTSRNANVRFPIYESAEKKLADWIGTEDALTVSSGYLAGQLVCQNLKKNGYDLFNLPGTHPALRPENGKSLTSKFRDLDTSINTSLANSKQPVLLLDSIDFHGQNYPHFETLRTLPLDEIVLVVDDSHGFGVVGEGGKGSTEALRKLAAKELIVCGSLNKGLATQAGVVLASKERISYFRNSDLFAGASPASPAALASFLEAQEHYRNRHTLLSQNLSFFSSRIACDQFFEYNPDHAGFSLQDPRLADHLEANGILITRFNYPTQTERPLNRIVINAAHKRGDIEKIAEVILNF